MAAVSGMRYAAGKKADGNEYEIRNVPYSQSTVWHVLVIMNLKYLQVIIKSIAFFTCAVAHADCLADTYLTWAAHSTAGGMTVIFTSCGRNPYITGNTCRGSLAGTSGIFT